MGQSVRHHGGLCEAGGVRADHGEAVGARRIEGDVGRVHTWTLAALASGGSSRPPCKADARSCIDAHGGRIRCGPLNADGIADMNRAGAWNIQGGTEVAGCASAAGHGHTRGQQRASMWGELDSRVVRRGDTRGLSVRRQAEHDLRVRDAGRGQSGEDRWSDGSECAGG